MNVRFCLDVAIREHSCDVELIDEIEYKTFNGLESGYYKVYYDDYDLIKKVEYYTKKSTLVTKWSFSNKGNLISKVIFFPQTERDEIHKIIYDYTHGQKMIKEKRFYKPTGEMVKKECYDKSFGLISITYYIEGDIYCIEKFNKNGVLKKTLYYNKDGMVI